MAQPTVSAITLNAGSGGADLAVTTYDSKDYQWAFACWWEESGNTPEVPSLASPFPVQPGTGVTFACSQSGTWNITNISGTISLPTGAATSAKQDTGNTSLASIDGKLTACNTGAVVISSALPAGTNTHGGVISQPSTSIAYNGTTSCTIKRATGLAATGTVAMIGAVADKKFRVLAIALVSTSATVTNVYVANGDNNILGDVSNPIPLAQDADGDNLAGFILPWNPGGWFETDTVNEALNVILSAAQDVIYALTYIEVT